MKKWLCAFASMLTACGPDGAPPVQVNITNEVSGFDHSQELETDGIVWHPSPDIDEPFFAYNAGDPQHVSADAATRTVCPGASWMGYSWREGGSWHRARVTVPSPFFSVIRLSRISEERFFFQMLHHRPTCSCRQPQMTEAREASALKWSAKQRSVYSPEPA
jgi:hypothetical protein